MSQQLLPAVQQHLSELILSCSEHKAEITVEVSPDNYHKVCKILLTNTDFSFEQLSDLCGVDYQTFPQQHRNNQERFAVVLHLLSYRHNQRIRVRVLLPDDNMPVIPSVTNIWAGANWFEREAFDLFGILFSEHEDLRRILTDYGFVGHPFRKDFPVVGNVEARYDPEQKRVVYVPVSIEERVIVPKIYRS